MFDEAFSGRKWFLQALGHEGLNNLLMAYKDKSAQAVCTFAYCSGPGHEPIIFEGRVTVSCTLHLAHITTESCKGENSARSRSYRLRYFMLSCTSIFDALRLIGAGWDPIFEFDGETYAEMDKAKKNTLSHRAVALSKLKQWFQAH